MRSLRAICFLAAVSAVMLGALLALTSADAQVELIDAGPYKLPGDCPAKHLTGENFEHDTQASGGMTSGNWLILFVPSNDGATTDLYSRQAVNEIASFDAFVRISTETLTTYQVLPAYVLCDESPALCGRFKVEKSSAKLVILSARRMYPYPSEQIRSVNDIELFVSVFRRIESSAIPPPLPGMTMWGQLILLLGGIIGILVLQSFATRHTSAPLPPSTTACRAKTD
ncbi:hypothetical protein LMXM_29_2621 [Leishmania mexicana MHOM/GT/2001/U1103]|uniref:Uncharacterized protein n=1 Tax=Leishmania mexicana (strain MHOM/GT/2001/U1103) TaxID=929439 RepID=E9B133_LEIMU|nr:hypothetical protein LMXM_29_2621 [Leishmania mexicana MHOM/GT/2001/U1103]CBZ28939.1 hypothetical protein LMXM_29_2621 [Leishmania mexicana MHOM/GT/2001/U1103]